MANDMVYARISSELRQRVKDDAKTRYEGNESMVFRTALELYLDLRERLGTNFDSIMDSWLQREKVA